MLISAAHGQPARGPATATVGSPATGSLDIRATAACPQLRTINLSLSCEDVPGPQAFSSKNLQLPG